MIGMQPLLEVALQLVLQLLDLGLGVLLRELDVALQLVDVLFELRARRLVQDRAAGVCAWSERLELLVLVAELRQLLVVQRPSASSTRPCRPTDVAAIVLHVDEGDLGVLRERRRRLGGFGGGAAGAAGGVARAAAGGGRRLAASARRAAASARTTGRGDSASVSARRDASTTSTLSSNESPESVPVASIV